MPVGSLADFRPRMQAQTRALRTLEPLAFRHLAGAVADVWSVHGDRDGGGHYVSPDPRVVIFLDDAPPPIAFSTGAPGTSARSARAFYVPQHVPMWSRMQSAGRMTHLDFHLDAGALQRRLAAGGVRADLTRPRFLETGAEIVTLGQLAAAEIRRPGGSSMLLDGLLTATLAAVFAGPETTAMGGAGGLAPWQMAAVERLVMGNLARPVTVAEMAAAVRLSESWFAHAFRRHTGQTPQDWQSELRLAAARDLIAGSDLPLAVVAQAAGFADQAHLSRRFRARFGQTPSDWRRQQFRSPEQIPAARFKTRADFQS